MQLRALLLPLCERQPKPIAKMCIDTTVPLTFALLTYGSVT
jgi:hypothetical protein